MILIRDKNLTSLQNLILISISSVVNKKSKCSYGDLVKECFDLFPGDFSLAEHPNLPDSLKLDRPLRDLREKGLIKGSVKTFFTLTDSGKNVSNQIKKNLMGSIRNNNFDKSKSTRSPALKVIEKVKNSEEFKKYLHQKKITVNDMKMRDILGYTLETPPETIINFLNYIKERASSEKEIVEFINLYINFLKK